MLWFQFHLCYFVNDIALMECRGLRLRFFHCVQQRQLLQTSPRAVQLLIGTVRVTLWLLTTPFSDRHWGQHSQPHNQLEVAHVVLLSELQETPPPNNRYTVLLAFVAALVSLTWKNWKSFYKASDSAVLKHQRLRMVRKMETTVRKRRDTER